MSIQDSSSSSDESSDEVAVKKSEEIDDKTNLKKPPTDNAKPVPKIKKSERSKCKICSGPERCNQQNKPEIFISCTSCKGNGMNFLYSYFFNNIKR